MAGVTKIDPSASSDDKRERSEVRFPGRNLADSVVVADTINKQGGGKATSDQLAAILASDEAWDTGQLGDDAEHVKVIEQDDAQIDEALGLQQISIRLQKSLIEDFKALAALNGMSYQPLMRQVLTRFADCEKKRILRERVAEMQQAKDQPPEPAKQKKVAVG